VSATPPSQATALPWLLHGVDGPPATQRKPIDAGFGDLLDAARHADAKAAPLDAVNDVLRSGGQPLAGPMRHTFEGQSGLDLAGVRLHEDERAAASARGVGARAYTVGRHIAIDPEAVPAGDRDQVLAHELVHVVQQRARDASSVHSIAAEDHALERDASRGADAAMRGGSVGAARNAAPEGVLFRQPRPGQAGTTVTRTPTDQDRRSFVADSIQFLRSAESTYAALTQMGPAAEPFGNAGSVRRVLAGFRSMMSGQGGIVLDDLGGDPKLYQGLRAAYTAAVAALLGGAAAFARRPVGELFDTYRGLIFEWAIPTQQLPGITTPLPRSAQQDAATHVATLTVGDVRVEFAPDVVVGPAPRAVTHHHIAYRAPGFRYQGGQVTDFDAVPPIVIRVQTRYPRNLNPADRSGYGRGTTREDVASGNTTLRFHESQHGTDYLRSVREHPAPQFGGRVGMTVADFQAAITAYKNAIAAYSALLDADSLQHTDCVGTTIDDYNGQRGDRRVQCVR
jgi:hypothetical protein